jgi:hypothetical protein
MVEEHRLCQARLGAAQPPILECAPFREMKMQPALERALRRRGLLKA